MAGLRPKALRILGEIMDIPLPGPDDDNYARILISKKDAATNVMNISLKADENCLRLRHTDALTRLYEAVQNEKARGEGRLLEHNPAVPTTH